jgi:hypothetical protein
MNQPSENTEYFTRIYCCYFTIMSVDVRVIEFVFIQIFFINVVLLPHYVLFDLILLGRNQWVSFKFFGET